MYWDIIVALAYEDGWNNWRDFFCVRVLPDKPTDISLASHVRKMVTVFLFDEFDERRSTGNSATLALTAGEVFWPWSVNTDYTKSPSL